MTEEMYYELLEKTISAVLSAKPTDINSVINTRIAIEQKVTEVFKTFYKKYYHLPADGVADN